MNTLLPSENRKTAIVLLSTADIFSACITCICLIKRRYKNFAFPQWQNLIVICYFFSDHSHVQVITLCLEQVPAPIQQVCQHTIPHEMQIEWSHNGKDSLSYTGSNIMAIVAVGGRNSGRNNTKHIAYIYIYIYVCVYIYIYIFSQLTQQRQIRATTCFGLVDGPSSGCSQNLSGDYTLGVVNIWGTRSRLAS
jgi:hypothetical protein